MHPAGTEGLGQQLLDHVAALVGQPDVQALESLRKPEMIEAEQMHDGRVPVIDVDRIFDRRPPQFVRLAQDLSAPDTAVNR